STCPTPPTTPSTASPTEFSRRAERQRRNPRTRRTFGAQAPDVARPNLRASVCSAATPLFTTCCAFLSTERWRRTRDGSAYVASKHSANPGGNHANACCEGRRRGGSPGQCHRAPTCAHLRRCRLCRVPRYVSLCHRLRDGTRRAQDHRHRPHGTDRRGA